MIAENDSIAKNLATVQQLEHRIQLRKYAEQKRQKTLDNVLRFKVGEIVLACLPCVSQLKVRYTKEENEAEFAPLREFLLQIATSYEYTTFHAEMTNRATSPKK